MASSSLALGRYYGVPANLVLDLACGAGLLSRQLAARVNMVVGLDANELMLDQAGRLTNEANVPGSSGGRADGG
jgi:2-polyprenyl-3-methyl-5-hydroxy-6-metoxy-1,4-benzoquinol methylase